MQRRPNRFLRKKMVMDRTGLTHSTLYRKVADGEFPEPIKLGERASAWLEVEVDQWMADRIAQSRAAS